MRTRPGREKKRLFATGKSLTPVTANSYANTNLRDSVRFGANRCDPAPTPTIWYEAGTFSYDLVRFGTLGPLKGTAQMREAEIEGTPGGLACPAAAGLPPRKPLIFFAQRRCW